MWEYAHIEKTCLWKKNFFGPAIGQMGKRRPEPGQVENVQPLVEIITTLACTSYWFMNSVPRLDGFEKNIAMGLWEKYSRLIRYEKLLLCWCGQFLDTAPSPACKVFCYAGMVSSGHCPIPSLQSFLLCWCGQLWTLPHPRLAKCFVILVWSALDTASSPACKIWLALIAGLVLDLNETHRAMKSESTQWVVIILLKEISWWSGKIFLKQFGNLFGVDCQNATNK